MSLRGDPVRMACFLSPGVRRNLVKKPLPVPSISQCFLAYAPVIAYAIFFFNRQKKADGTLKPQARHRYCPQSNPSQGAGARARVNRHDPRSESPTLQNVHMVKRQRGKELSVRDGHKPNNRNLSYCVEECASCRTALAKHVPLCDNIWQWVKYRYPKWNPGK